MSETRCLKSQLPLLIQEELSPAETHDLMEHLETCETCQAELETISADVSWWNRARQGLERVETDREYRLRQSEPSVCTIESLLDKGSEPTTDDNTSSDTGYWEPPAHPETLGRIDDFEVEEKIGQGGMGVVYRGFDRALNRPVAIKVMGSHLGANPVARQRFEREARAAAAVVHPNVVSVYRVSKTRNGNPYIAMALADGLSLQESVERHGPFDVKDVIRIAAQIAGGLAEAHRQGVIHRDIKPANVLMEKDVSRIMITDFGLARAVDDVMMTQSGCLAGTPNYMSPEQVIGDELDHRSDLFSLGSLMYFISTGREPFRAESAFAVINNVTRVIPKPPRMINVDIPEILNRLVERLLEKAPNKRIESAAKLEEILLQILAHLQEPNQHQLPSVKPTTTATNRNWKRIGWLGIALGIAAVGFIAWKGMSEHGLSSIGIPNAQDKPTHELAHEGDTEDHSNLQHSHNDGHQSEGGDHHH